MASEYKWQKNRRGKGYIPPLLSKEDECVPKTHIPMYRIFRNPKNTSVYMSEEACQKMRQKTYQNVYELYRKYGSPNYVDFFNVNREEINELGLNEFAKHPKIAPVSGLIECFSKETRLKSNNKRRMSIGFGINRKLLNQYFANVAKAKETGTEVVIPKLKRANQKDKDIVIFGEAEINIGNSQKVKIPRNALYNQFEHWCLLQGVSKKEGILMAIELIIQQYPITGIGEVGEYKVSTEFDRYVYLKKSQSEPQKLLVRFDGDIFSLALTIIENYNLDPENASKPYMDFNTYVNNAVHLLNSNIDLKYRSPRLYKERCQTEEMERYNKTQKELKELIELSNKGFC